MKKKVVMLVFLLSFGLYGCSQEKTEISNQEDSSESEAVSESSSSESESSFSSESSVESSEESSENIEIDVSITPEMWANKITQSLNGESEAIYDAKNFEMVIYIKNDNELAQYIGDTRFGLTSRDPWNEMVEEYKELSIEIVDTTKRVIRLILANPFNPEVKILEIFNGTVLYDIMQEEWKIS